MAVLVAGGFGHIGSGVCREPAMAGSKVIAAGRTQRRRCYLQELDARIAFVSADLPDQAKRDIIRRNAQGAPQSSGVRCLT